jgi:hypothetical protein
VVLTTPKIAEYNPLVHSLSLVRTSAAPRVRSLLKASLFVAWKQG